MSETPALTFSFLLRKYRRLAGLSQEELAERADLSRRTISDLERGVKSTPQPATLGLLVEALALSEDDRRSLLESVPKRSRRTRPAIAGSAITFLPADLTPLVGREHDEAAGVHLIHGSGVRLLTLLGTGGVGKTRLAVRIAETVGGSYRDGARFVSLAAASAADQVPELLARTLEMQDRSARPTLERLIAFLRDKEMLLLLDNFEHVVSAAEMVNHLLLSCPNVTVLATSRAQLRLRAEHLFDVSPLSIPDRTDLTVEEALSYPSVALFVQRAQAGRSSFSLSDGTVSTVVEICRSCDGLPLAIELAAARVRHLSAEEIWARLRAGDLSTFTHAMDAPPRHQTMLATIRWSYDLLDAREQRMFRSLSVFRGDGSVDSIQELFGAEDGDVIGRLDSLRSKSLVAEKQGGRDKRIEMLETVREFALVAAAEAGELDRLKAAHASYYVRLAEEIVEIVRRHGPATALPKVTLEYDNLLAALEWLTENQMPAEALAVANCLGEFWIFWGQIEEGRSRLDNLIERSESAHVGVPGFAYTMAARMAWIQNDFDRAARLHQLALEKSGSVREKAVALNNLGTVAHLQTDYQRAAGYYEQAIEHARHTDSDSALAMPLGNLGVIAMQQRDYERAGRLLDEAVALYRRIGDEQRVAIMLANRGSLAYRQGQPREAAELHREALAMKRAMGDGLSVGTSLGDLALAHLELEELAEAEELLQEALGIFVRAGQKDGIAEAARAMGRTAQKRGDLTRAARLYAGAEALRSELGIQVHPADLERYEAAIAELRAAIPGEQLEPEWERGRRVTLDELVKTAGHPVSV